MKRTSLAAIAAGAFAVMAVASPTPAEAQPAPWPPPPPQPPPPYYAPPPPPPRTDYKEQRTRDRLVIGGGVAFGAAYLISIAIAIGGVSSDHTGLAPLFIPVVGPFVTLGTSGVFDEAENGAHLTGNVFGAIGLVLDGLVQTAGLAVAAVGLFAPKRTIRAISAPAASGADVAIDPALLPEIAVVPGGVTARWVF